MFAVCMLATTASPAHAALRKAAGGGSSGGGFADLTKYLDTIAGYLIPVGGSLAVIGLIYGGSLLMTGSPYAGRTLVYVVVGVVIVLASKGLAA